MARTKAVLGSGARLSDFLAASLLARVVPADVVHAVLNEHGCNSQRVRSFPAVAGVYYCMALSRVYTFGPTFRAENSNTSRHLAEFWMVEPEVAYLELDGLMDLCEDFLCSIVQRVLEVHEKDLSEQMPHTHKPGEGHEDRKRASGDAESEKPTWLARVLKGRTEG